MAGRNSALSNRRGVDAHQAPEPINLPSALAVDVEAGPSQALLQFSDAERVHMGVARPGQYAIQQSHPDVVPAPVGNDQVTVRGYHSPNFPQCGIDIQEVMHSICAGNQLKARIIER